MLIGVVLGACSTIWPRAAPLPPPDPGPPYPAQVARIEAVRSALAAGQAQDVAGPALAASIVDLIHAWYGTPWDFYGTALQPGEEPIACGHFVAGVLADAGLEVERRRLGQQAAEHIIQTVTSEDSIRRYRSATVNSVVADVRSDGPGVYIVGLDHHVGFLVHHDDGVVGFCHSTYLEDLGVVCEDPLRSPALPSRYTVVGKVGEPALLEAWLTRRSLPTVGTAEE